MLFGEFYDAHFLSTLYVFFFFFNDTATPEIYPLPLHAALPIYIEALENANQKQQARARQHVADQLTQMAPVFTKQKYMLGDEFSMLDVAISPLLWRLDYYGVAPPQAAAPLLK